MGEGRLEHPFKPIVYRDTDTLILGSFPSIDSFDKGFYYAHPRNQFWKILTMISGYPSLIKDQKYWLLKKLHIGLWDVIASCSRENSLDSSLYDEEVNDIPSLLEVYPSIRRVAFTGRKAQTLFEANFGHMEIERNYLPSPSAAYARMNIEEKAAIYKELLLERKENR